MWPLIGVGLLLVFWLFPRSRFLILTLLAAVVIWFLMLVMLWLPVLV